MVDASDRLLLGEFQLLKGLSDGQLDAIHAAAEVAWFDSGTAITQAGDWGAAAYLVVSGSVMVADASASSGYPEPLGPGTFIGELAMLSEVSYAATVIAAEPVRVLAIERDALYAVLEADPDIAEHMSSMLAHRLSSLAEELRAVDERFETLETSLQHVADAA